MSVHHKISETVVPYVCSQRDCEHWALGDGSECPTEVMEVCEEHSKAAWEEWEGPVVAWEDCFLRPCTTCGEPYSEHWGSEHEWTPSADVEDRGQS